MWLDRHRGRVDPTDKESADALAIGCIRDAAASLDKLTFADAYRANLGLALTTLFEWQHFEHLAASWLDATVARNGSVESSTKPPAEAITAVKRSSPRQSVLIACGAASSTDLSGSRIPSGLGPGSW